LYSTCTFVVVYHMMDFNELGTYLMYLYLPAGLLPQYRRYMDLHDSYIQRKNVAY